MSLAKTHQDVVEVGVDCADAEKVGIETFVAKVTRETIAKCCFGELQKGIHIMRPVTEITFLHEFSHGGVAADVFDREFIGFQILQSVLDIIDRFCVAGVPDHGCEAADSLQVLNLIAMAVQTHVDFSESEFCGRKSVPVEMVSRYSSACSRATPMELCRSTNSASQNNVSWQAEAMPEAAGEIVAKAVRASAVSSACGGKRSISSQRSEE